MNQHILDAISKVFGMALALIVLGVIANVCWLLIYFGWSIVDFIRG